LLPKLELMGGDERHEQDFKDSIWEFSAYACSTLVELRSDELIESQLMKFPDPFDKCHYHQVIKPSTPPSQHITLLLSSS